MKAEIKYINSSDVFNLETFKPEIEDNFGFPLRVIVGPKGEQGEESFDMMLCTPKWMETNYKEDAIFFGTHYLIVFKYNYQKIYQKLKDSIESIEAPDWTSIGEEIAKLGKWEFEDYKDA